MERNASGSRDDALTPKTNVAASDSRPWRMRRRGPARRGWLYKRKGALSTPDYRYDNLGVRMSWRPTTPKSDIPPSLRTDNP